MAIWERLVREEEGQDVAEYAAMLALMLGIAIATLHFIGSSANATFASIASRIQ